MIDESTDLTALQTQLASQQAQLDQSKREVAAEAIRRLEAHHQDICSQCRQAEDALKQIESQMAEARSATVRATSEIENTRRHVGDWQEMKPGTTFVNAEGRTEYRVSQFPTAEEHAHWERELWRRQQAATMATVAESEAWRNYELARVAWHRERDKFSALADKAEQIRNDLALNPGKSRIVIEDLSGRGVSMA